MVSSSKFRIFGGDGDRSGRGISVAGDVLVNVTADGVDLNAVWAEDQQVLEVWNTQRQTLADLISFRTVNVADAIIQSISSESFEEATEVGVPRAVHPPSDVLKLGYTFKDYDLSLRSSWKFLRDATSEQITAGVTRILEADNKLTTGMVLKRLLNPGIAYNEWNATSYGLWSADGMIPPPYLGTTFTGTHNHYLTTGSTTLDAADVEVMINHVIEHGYMYYPASTLLLLMNPLDFNSSGITAWRAGIEYATGLPVPNHDFIPSALMPTWISNELIHGPVPASEFNGLQVWGSYANALVIHTNFLPAGYTILLATGGPNSDINPVGFREHVNVAYQGLRHIPGAGPYPIVDSFFARGFGVGTRHRGAAVAMQTTTNASYTAPVIPT
jgi:hypothetical protein